MGAFCIKTSLYHLQSSEIAERIVLTVKIGLKSLFTSRDATDCNLLGQFLPHADRLQSSSTLIGRQIIFVTMSYLTKGKLWYKKILRIKSPEKAKFKKNIIE